MEVASQVNMDESGGIVFIVRDRCASVACFDMNMFQNMADILDKRNCMPVNCAASHLCSLPLFTRKIIKPIVFAMMSTRTRARTCLHDVPAHQSAEALACYGITRDMLPTEWAALFESTLSNGLLAVELWS